MLAITLASAPDLAAERLPLRQYLQRDGLAQNNVSAIHQDLKGYLWFGTREGLSRFDGERFTNYGVQDGLGHPIVNTITEDAHGRIWVGTNGGGVARLVGRRRFVSFLVGTTSRENRVNEMAFDRTGILWCLTDHGLFRSTAAPTDTVTFELAWRFQEAASTMGSLVDPDGSIWMSYFDGLLHIRDGRFTYYALPARRTAGDMPGLARDRAGRLLFGFPEAVYAFTSPSTPGDPPQWTRLPLTFPSGEWIVRMIGDRQGTLWLGTNQRLLLADDSGRVIKPLTTNDGLPDTRVSRIFEDRHGDVWLGTLNGGLCRLLRSPVVSIMAADGLPGPPVYRIVIGQDGRVYAKTNRGVAEIVDGRAALVRGSDAPRFAGTRSALLQDRRGDWWVGSRDGAYRFTGPALQFARGSHTGPANGLPPSVGEAPYEDARGRLWMISGNGPELYVAERGSDDRVRFAHIGEIADGQPMLGDRAGTMWMGSTIEPGGRRGRIQRWRGDARETLAPTAGLPSTFSRSFFLDSRGWLWIGLAHDGVSMTRDPDVAAPAFVNISTRDGLSSDGIWSIAEDDTGRMYFGTQRGLDQYEPDTRRIRHLTVADGLAGEEVLHCVKDQRGYIWAATTSGVSRIDPRAIVPPTRAPDVYLTRVIVAGEDLPIDETGVRAIADLHWRPDQNNLLLEFVAPYFGHGGALAYEYRLDGLDREWTRATEHRRVTYAFLAPGAYRFQVRALDQEEGLASSAAVLAFEILPPVWQRSWFIVLVAATVAAALYGVYRLRVGQLLAMERIRMQIATDLHDDVGSSLAQIAILSEVVRRDTPPAGAALLDRAASLARGLRESMSDIVWAIDPDKDRVLDLVTRMKEVAFNTLEADGVAVTF